LYQEIIFNVGVEEKKEKRNFYLVYQHGVAEEAVIGSTTEQSSV
jgi:hypothetical protein